MGANKYARVGINMLPFGEDLGDVQDRCLLTYVQAQVKPLGVPLFKIALYHRDGIADMREMGTIKIKLAAWNEQAAQAELRNLLRGKTSGDV